MYVPFRASRERAHSSNAVNRLIHRDKIQTYTTTRYSAGMVEIANNSRHEWQETVNGSLLKSKSRLLSGHFFAGRTSILPASRNAWKMLARLAYIRKVCSSPELMHHYDGRTGPVDAHSELYAVILTTRPGRSPSSQESSKQIVQEIFALSDDFYCTAARFFTDHDRSLFSNEQ